MSLGEVLPQSVWYGILYWRNDVREPDKKLSTEPEGCHLCLGSSTTYVGG